MAEPPFTVTVHPYPVGKSGTAYGYELGTNSNRPARNALVFIGGLYDGPQTVGYPRVVARNLQEAPGLDYSVFETRLSSSFSGFGFSSLARDVKELSKFVAYLRGIGKEKIVFMGHSTGSQDCMEYSDPKHGANAVDGFILQGPVSDREAFSTLMAPAELRESIKYAETLIADGKANAIMPQEKVAYFETPISAYRWHSLLSAGGDDDYFSSDLPDEKLAAVWGRIQKPLLIVPSEQDQYIPESVNKLELLARWKRFCKPGIASDLSGLIPGANHQVEEADSREWLADTVVKFLEGIETAKSKF